LLTVRVSLREVPPILLDLTHPAHSAESASSSLIAASLVPFQMGGLALLLPLAPASIHERTMAVRDLLQRL